MRRIPNFMALDPAEVGYPISQIGAAATRSGASSSHVSAFAGDLMQHFGYRCSPRLSVTDGPHLKSICKARDCFYVLMSNCKLYGHDGCHPQPMVAPQCMKSQHLPPNSTSTYTTNPSKSSESPSTSVTNTKYWALPSKEMVGHEG